MRRTPWTPRRRLALVGLAASLVAALVLAVVVSPWFVAPVPVLAGAVWATVLGLSPSRFLDVLADPAAGTGTQLPF